MSRRRTHALWTFWSLTVGAMGGLAAWVAWESWVLAVLGFSAAPALVAGVALLDRVVRQHHERLPRRRVTPLGPPASLELKLQALRSLRRDHDASDWVQWTDDGVDLLFQRVGVGFADWVRGRGVVRVRVRARGIEVDGTWFESVDLRSVRLLHGRLVLEEDQGSWTSPALVVRDGKHVVELLQQVVPSDEERRAEAQAAAEARVALDAVRRSVAEREP